MSRATTIRCDVCQIAKKETNHWWVAALRNDRVLTIRPMTAKGNASVSLDLCGQACAHKLLDRWMATGKLEKSE